MQVCGCGHVCVCRCVCVGVSVCAGVWVWACQCVQVCGCVGVSAGVWVWVCLCRCMCVFAYVQCVGQFEPYIILFIALTFLFPFHSPSLPHTTSSFHVYYSSSLFIRLRLVIVHLTTQRCRDSSVSSKRWRLTALNMIRVFHTPPITHTHAHALGEICSEMSPSMSP